MDMDEILSSIRNGVEVEAAKVGESDDLITAAAAQDGPEIAHEEGAVTASDIDDILELSSAEMVEDASPAAAGEEVIDLAAFAQSGAKQMVAAPSASDMAALAAELLGEDVGGDVGAMPVVEPEPVATPTAEDDFDKLLAEISSDKEQKAVEADQKKQELLAEEDPLGDVNALLDEVNVAPVAIEDAVVMPEEPMSEASTAAYTLGMVEGTGGPQVAFPAEVLAMALRPMVQQWLSQNLPGIVDRLVKEEISKMTQN